LEIKEFQRKYKAEGLDQNLNRLELPKVDKLKARIESIKIELNNNKDNSKTDNYKYFEKLVLKNEQDH